MEINVDWYNYVPTLLSGLIYAYLVYRGMKWHMLEEFRTFYLYVIVSSLASIANWTVITEFGYSSLAYLYTYYSGQAIKVLCELAILAGIYQRIHRPVGFGRHVPTLFAVATVLGVGWWLRSVNFWQVDAVPLLVQLVFLTVIWIPGLLRRRIVNLGLNWCGLLIGLSLAALLKLNYMGLSLAWADSGSGVEQWKYLIQPIEFAPWVIFALTMNSRDSTRISRRGPRPRRRVGTAAEDRSRSPRSVFGPEVARRVR